MMEELKRRVYEANVLVQRYGLITLTWGNVSELDRARGIFAIKPSGVSYEAMKPEDMVLVDLDGNQVEGRYRPSTDTRTHLALYHGCPDIGGICHTHSEYAVSFAQAERDLPCYGTTGADYFYGSVPCTRNLTDDEIAEDYEKSTGAVIVETFVQKGLDPLAIPGVLVSKHGPFAWGATGAAAVENALVLEISAKMALQSELLNGAITAASQSMLDKHYFRKHGAGAYYGQGAKR